MVYSEDGIWIAINFLRQIQQVVLEFNDGPAELLTKLYKLRKHC
jgi:hypothetical protein